MYKVKGTGDTREIRDEVGALIGRIHRNERKHTHWRGSCKSISISMRTTVYWTASFPDGAPVCWVDDKKRKGLEFMRDWAKPGAWVHVIRGEENGNE